MPKLKYTPGDWQFGFSDGSGRPDVAGGYGGCVRNSDCPGDSDNDVVSGYRDAWGLPVGVVGRTQEEAEANGVLIANAARMYEALRDLLSNVRSAGWDVGDESPAGRARALIEKMEGEGK